MKHFFTILLVVFSIKSYSYCNDTNQIQLEDHQKAKQTFSGELENLNSFHVIIAKNTKTNSYDILPSVFNFEEQKLKQYDVISSNKLPSILSFHYNGDTITLITTIRDKKNQFMKVIDINRGSGEIISSKFTNIKDITRTIRLKHKTFLFFSFKDKFKVTVIENNNSIKSINVLPEENTMSFFKSIFKESIDVISYDKFTGNGSIKNNKLYATDKKIIITREDAEENKTELIEIPVDKANEIRISSKSFKQINKGLKKKQASFVINDKLYQFKLSKESAPLLSFNLGDDDVTEIELDPKDFYKEANGFKDLETFFKRASKAKNQPTITLNKTVSNEFLLRLNYVNTTTYYYNNDWFFRWQQQLQFQQNIPISAPTFRGPSPEYYDKLAFQEGVVANDNGSYFELLIDENNNIIKNKKKVELIHKDVDFKEYDEVITYNSNYKFPSSLIIGNQFRYFVYHKKTDSFRVFKKDLDD